MNSDFWINNPKILFKDIKFIPNHQMAFEDKINTITRLVFIISLILYISGYKQSFLFFLLSLFLIIILYYIQEDKMPLVETYIPKIMDIKSMKKMEELHSKSIDNYKKNRYTVEKFPEYFADQRQMQTEIQPNQTYISKNQNLVGKANSKTLVAPVVAPPSYDWQYWKGNDLVYPSIINEKRSQDYYGSGYFTEETPVIEHFTSAKSYSNNTNAVTNLNSLVNTNTNVFNNPSSDLTQPYYPNEYTSPQQPLNFLGDYDGKYSKNINTGSSLGTENIVPKDILRMSRYKNQDYTSFNKKEKELQTYSGDINKSCTYDTTNLDYNLPTNFMAGNCERNQTVKELNKQIFTSTVTPGVYYNSQIIEPINSNIGISFDQQIPSRKVSKDSNGNIIYTAMDPTLYSPVDESDTTDYGTAPYEVYDPRTNGYGTSYRNYNDEMTGQPRFFYDDVNAVRRPNFVLRSNIDHLLNADSYGVIKDNKDTISTNCNIRKIAEEGLLNNVLDHRTDMMNRLMRKTNAEAWQQRLAPIRTGANFVMK